MSNLPTDEELKEDQTQTEPGDGEEGGETPESPDLNGGEDSGDPDDGDDENESDGDDPEEGGDPDDENDPDDPDNPEEPEGPEEPEEHEPGELAFVVEDGSGLSDSSSFCSVVFANSYARIHGKVDWLNLETEQKQITLVLATDYVNSNYDWRGEVVNADQALAHPRCGFSIPSGKETTEVPTCVKKAVAELATRCFSLDAEGNVSYIQLVDDNETPSSIKSFKNVLEGLSQSVVYAGPGEVRTDVRPFPAVDAMIESWLLKGKTTDVWGSVTSPAVVTGVCTCDVDKVASDPCVYTGFPKLPFFGGEDD